MLAVAFQGAPTFSGPRVLLPAGPQLTGKPLPAETGTPDPQQLNHPLRIDLSWLLVALIVLAVVIALALLWRLRRRPAPTPELPELAELSDSDVSDAPRDNAPEPEPQQVLRGLDRASAELSEQREPRDAIERAWVGLEEGAADSGVRRLPAETPAEFAARIVARVAADREAARRFLALYLRARFSTSVVTPQDVDDARTAVTALRASWNAAPAQHRPSTSVDRFGARP